MLKPKTPVIVLAFANEYTSKGFLRKLTAEMKGILKALEPSIQKGRIHVKLIPAATQEEITAVFQDEWYEGRIWIFHYGGHADQDELWLEGESGGNKSFFSLGLSRFLAAQKGLKLVFLNACSTGEQANLLSEAGISAVVGTSSRIADDQASLFSASFYRGLTSGNNITESFKEAEGIVLGSFGQPEAPVDETSGTRTLFWPDETEEPDELPWKLTIKEGNEVVVNLWRLFYEVKEPTEDEPLFAASFVGQTINNYSIKRFLGQGRFGQVFEAIHTNLNEKVAIKISHKVLEGYDDLKNIIFSGTKGLATLNHPNVVKFKDAGEMDIFGQKRIYVVMEFLPGKSLDKLDLGLDQLKGNEFGGLVEIALKICEGMKAAHNLAYMDANGVPRNGMIHGNLKPKKILFSPTGEPKVIDFLFTDLARSQSILLDIPDEVKAAASEYQIDDYYPPEVVQGHTTINKQTDIFGIGATFWELITRKRLSEVHFISSDEMHGIIRQFSRNFPKDISRIIYGALNEDPDERYAQMGDMIEDLVKETSFWRRMKYRVLGKA